MGADIWCYGDNEILKIWAPSNANRGVIRIGLLQVKVKKEIIKVPKIKGNRMYTLIQHKIMTLYDIIYTRLS